VTLVVKFSAPLWLCGWPILAFWGRARPVTYPRPDLQISEREVVNVEAL